MDSKISPTTDHLTRGNVKLDDRTVLNIRVGSAQEWKSRHELNVANTAEAIAKRAREGRAEMNGHE